MPRFHPTNPLVTDIDAEVLEAQRQTNALLVGFPHPDVRTPEGLATLRTLTANNEQGTRRVRKLGHGHLQANPVG